jgi:hypothetical protein
MADNIKIMGNTVGVPNPRSDWRQTDPTKADYIKNKPDIESKADKEDIPVKLSDIADDITQRSYEPTSEKPQSGKAVAEAIAKLLGSAPANLDTLEELAKALNEDENFSASVLAEIAKKADATALANKVDKVSGKGLSTNDFTNALKTRLADSVIVSTSVALGYNAKEYFNEKTGFGAEFIQWDEDGSVSDAQVLIFTWGERYVQNSTGDYEPGNYQSVIYPDGEVYYRTKLFEEEWTEEFKDSMRFEWTKVSVSQTDLDKKADTTALAKKVDKVSGMGLSEANFTNAEKEKLSKTQIFTNDLKTRLENNTFDYYIETKEYGEEFDFDSYTNVGIYLLYNDNCSDDEERPYYILTVSYWYDYSADEVIGVTTQTLLSLNYGTIKNRERYGDSWSSWKKISVSQTDLDNAIGDIETSLENIIQKYGLGGDGV